MRQTLARCRPRTCCSCSRTDKVGIWLQFRDNFAYFSIKTYVGEVILISTYYVCFYGEYLSVVTKYPLYLFHCSRSRSVCDGFFSSFRLLSVSEGYEILFSFLISGFTYYLLSQECDIFEPEHHRVCQDMTQPLSHYYVASSHNTWVLREESVRVGLRGHCVKIVRLAERRSYWSWTS